MEKRYIKLISFLLVAVTVFSLVSCNRTVEEPGTEEPLTSKNTTQAPVKIVEIPTAKGELTEMLNAAIEYVELYCYHYTKHTVCNADSVNVGSLATVSNAAEAFRSIFGKKDVAIEYNYNMSRDSFAANFPESGYTMGDISLITAQQVGDSIVITADFPNENSPSENSGMLRKMSNEYVSVESVNKALSDFNSSAKAVSVTASDIQIKATISATDSSLTALEVSYTQNFNLTGVTLVKLEGSVVTGSAKTTVTYSKIGV